MNSPLANLLARDLGDDRDEVADVADVELTLEISDDEADGDERAGQAPSAFEVALREAAARAEADDVGLDAFMKAAWGAYLDAHPELQAQIERQALLGHLKLLRRAGKIGQA